MTSFVALLRRELWEHRALVIVPLVLGALMLGCTLYAVIRGLGFVGEFAHSQEMTEVLAHPEASKMILGGYMAVATAFGLVLCVVIVLYLTDCLYADRRDRSILFWKSMPVSDATTVLSKLTTALVIAPAVTLAVAFVTTIGLMLMGTIALWVNDVPGTAVLWHPGEIARAFVGVPFVATLLLLWYAPVAAWFLLASAWAPRAPMMWAMLPPLGLIILEQVTFQTTRIPEFIGERMSAVYPRLFDARDHVGIIVDDGDIEFSAPTLRNVFEFTTSVDLWGGLVVAALLTAGAIALRRYRDET